MPVAIENQAYGRLAGSITPSSTTISLQAGHGLRFGIFPAGTFKTANLIRTDNTVEFVKITARSGDTLTVVRGQQGSTALSFSINDRIEMVPDKGTLAEFPQLGLVEQSLWPAGTVTAMTATLASGGDAASLLDGFQVSVRALGANTSATPTFNLTIGSSPTGPKIITRPDGSVLSPQDIPGLDFRMELRYTSSLDRWLLQNPATLATSEIAQAPHWGMNAVINGDMRFAQRGIVNNSAIANALSGYTLDRWQANRTGDAPGLNVYRSSDADVPSGSQHALVMHRAVGDASAAGCFIFYTGAREDTVWLQGRVVAFTFRAKAGANYSGGLLQALLRTTSFHSGADARSYEFTILSMTVINSSLALTTSWQQFTAFGTIPADAQQFGMQIQWLPTGVAGANDLVRITRVRVAPAIVRSGVAVAAPVVPPIPFAVERSLCERYFERITPQNGGRLRWAGHTATGAAVWQPVPHRGAMRVAPTIGLASAAWTLTGQAAGGAMTVASSETDAFVLQHVNSNAPGAASFQLTGGHVDVFAEI